MTNINKRRVIYLKIDNIYVTDDSIKGVNNKSELIRLTKSNGQFQLYFDQ